MFTNAGEESSNRNQKKMGRVRISPNLCKFLAPGAVFTTFHFLRILEISAISYITLG